MNKQQAMIRELQKQGVDATETVPQKEWNKARIAVRTPKELVRDGARMFRAQSDMILGISQVPDEQREKNLEICRTNRCGSYDVLENGDEACWRCTCAGKRALKAKTGNQREYCPANPPFWDNRKQTDLSLPFLIPAT